MSSTVNQLGRRQLEPSDGGSFIVRRNLGHTRGMLRRIAFLLLLAPVTGLSQDSFSGARSFTQFRDVSGLPGAAFGVTPEGKVSIHGAMALSTPIGFGLSDGVWDVGAASRSVDNHYRFPNLSLSGRSNSVSGRGQVMRGFKTPVGNLTLSYMLLSAIFDASYNAQLQLPIRSTDFGVSVGVQNLTNRANAAPQDDPHENDLSRSYFVAGTKKIGRSGWLTSGVGDLRFGGGFASFSDEVSAKLRGLIEYDGYGWNGGFGYSLGTLPGQTKEFRNSEVTLWLGFVQTHRATAALNIGF